MRGDTPTPNDFLISENWINDMNQPHHLRGPNKIKQRIRESLTKFPFLYEAITKVLGRNYVELGLMRKLVRPGDNILDIGANTGQFTFLLSAMAGKEGSVHAFEPNPIAFSQLIEARDRITHAAFVVLNNCALSAENAPVSLYIPNGDMTQASIAHHEVHSWNVDNKSKIEKIDGINAVTIDGYLEANNLQIVNFVKCDVEGAELLVLKGGTKLLSSALPPILLLELYVNWTKDFGYTSDDAVGFLKKYKYQGWHIGKAGMTRLTESLKPSKIGKFPDELNYLFAMPSIHSTRLALLKYGN